MRFKNSAEAKTEKAENGKLYFWNLVETKTEKAENGKLHFLKLGGS